MTMKMATSLLTIAQFLSASQGVIRGFAVHQSNASTKEAAPAQQCTIKGKTELTITCTYVPAPGNGADSRSIPKIVLHRAVLSFETSDESHMSVDLTFSNESGKKIAEARTVYLAIDDPTGLNHMRRPLPSVDFTKLTPGKPVKFHETLLAPAFSQGPYVISIWIPAAEPAFKFDNSRNLLISSMGVPDPATGLNHIAQFNSPARQRRGSSDKDNH